MLSKSFDVDELFRKRDCYESAPPSTVFTPNKLHTIQQPQSAPLVMNKADDDLINLEDLISQQDVAAKSLYPVLNTTTEQIGSSSIAMNTDEHAFKETLVQENDAFPKSPYFFIRFRTSEQFSCS